MQSLSAPRPQRPLIISLVIVALVCAGLLGWWRHGQTPGTEEVSAFLNRTAGAGRVRFSVVKMDVLSQGSDSQLTVVATARSIGPLYTKNDAADYLRNTLRLDAVTAEEARRLLSSPGASAQPEFQSVAPFPSDPYAAEILRVISPAGTPFAFRGVLDAHRESGSWNFALLSGGFEGAGPQGELRAAFGNSAYAVGDTGDEARLRVLVTNFEAFAGRVAGLRQNRAAVRAAAAEERRKAFLAQIAPGRVFRGTAVDAGTHRETPLYLEITGLSPENEVRAILRNDDSWRLARPFQGTWSADEHFEKTVLTLTSLPNQAVRNAGPFLSNSQVWKFALRVEARGELTEENKFFQYQFQPITAEQVAALQARLDGEFERAIAATEPGVLYLGTAVSRASGAAEPMFLRFGPRTQGSESLEASFESTVRTWKRPLHGTVATNASRSGGAPIRLQTGPNEAVEEAPATRSALGDHGELNLRLSLEQGTLVGGDERFTYKFAVAGAADLQRLEASRLERVRRLDAVMRSGIVYDGAMRTDRGYVFRTRLEFTKVDRSAGVMTVRFRSLERPKVFREFLGTWDPAGDSIELKTADQAVWDNTAGFKIPFFIPKSTATLHLVLTENSLTGRIAGDPHWEMIFSADAFLSVPTEGAETNSPFADGGVFPPLPKNEGAYLLGQGNWVSLPTNHGHVVAEPVPKPDDDEEAAIALRALKGIKGDDDPPEETSKGKGKEKPTIPYLMFDGKDPRPANHGPVIVLLFVGPASAGEPEVELARAQTLADGRRRVKIMGGSPTTIRVGEQRLAAYVRRVAPNAILLTTTSATARGAYIFNAGAGYELIQE